MNADLEILIAKYLTGDADENEKQRVEEWVGSSEANRKEFEKYRSLWKRTEVAANYSDAEVEQALKHTKQKISGFRRRRALTWFRQAAAVVILSLLISSLYTYFSNGKIYVADNKPVIQEITALNGMSTKVDLADGSSVFLYPGSKLSFPVTFKNKTREVKLSGEGFFCVAHDDDKPFVVKTSELNIKVLGTKFNLRANADEDFVETILVEGKVCLEKEMNGRTVEMKVLKPDQRAVYRPDEGKVKVFKEKNIDKHIAWTKGTLVFDADPMDKVVKELERWYNVDIEIRDESIRKDKLTGKFSGEPIREVLSLLQYSSDFKYKIEKRKEVDGKYQKKKIILMK